EPEHPALLGQAVDPELVSPVRPDDRQRETARELGRAAGMVDVRMREQDLLELHILVAYRGEDPVEVAARVDDRAGLRALAPDEGAVLRKRRDRYDGGAHVRSPSGSLRAAAAGPAPRP